jgi:hypothetical protein
MVETGQRADRLRLSVRKIAGYPFLCGTNGRIYVRGCPMRQDNVFPGRTTERKHAQFLAEKIGVAHCPGKDGFDCVPETLLECSQQEGKWTGAAPARDSMLFDHLIFLQQVIEPGS